MSERSFLGSPLLSLWRLTLYAGLTLPLMPIQALAVAFKLPLRRSLPQWYHGLCCRIFGFKVETKGEPQEEGPVLYVCNHISYLDITVIGAILPSSFIAKSEVAGWPFFGWLAKLQETVFVVRAPQEVGRQSRDIQERLEAGDSLILFAEGTSGDGNHVLPFKSGLFSVAERMSPDLDLRIQPVTIAYTRLDGLPMGRYLRPFFAWYGDMELAGHLCRAMGMGRVTVDLLFHDAVKASDFSSRKALCDHCYSKVTRGMAQALSGAWQPDLKPSEEDHSGTAAVTRAVGKQ